MNTRRTIILPLPPLLVVWISPRRRILWVWSVPGLAGPQGLLFSFSFYLFSLRLSHQSRSFAFRSLLRAHSFLLLAPPLWNVVHSSSKSVDSSWSICSLTFSSSEESSVAIIRLQMFWPFRVENDDASVYQLLDLPFITNPLWSGWWADGIDSTLGSWFYRLQQVVSTLVAILNRVPLLTRTGLWQLLLAKSTPFGHTPGERVAHLHSMFWT